MNKKIVLGLLLLVVAAVGIGVVCAGETIDIDGCTFNIPDGYNKTNSTSSHAYFSNGAGDSYSIEVKQSYSGNASVYGDTSSINGKEGVLRSFNEGKCQFIYNDNGKMITITAPDQSIIESIISA